MIGIELELYVRDKANAQKFELNTPSWNKGSDGSIHTESNQCSYEIRTKPISLEKLEVALAEIDKVKTILGVNESCGLHIHHSFTLTDKNLQKRSIKNLYKLVFNNQAILNHLTASWRENNSYSQNIGYNTTKELAKARTPLKLFTKIYGNTEIDFIKDALDHKIKLSRKNGSRYFTLNLLPLLDLGTVEFRLFQATTDIELIRFYATLVDKLCLKATNTKKVRLLKFGKSLEVGNTYSGYRKIYQELYQFLRQIDYLDSFEFAKKIMRGLEKKDYI